MPDYDNDVLGVGNSMHPANQVENKETEVTIDESWYDELIEDRQTLMDIKVLFREWYKLNSFPLEKTSDEMIKLSELENKLIKKIGL